MLAPFLKAKRALFFSKIVDKKYGAGLVVSENHLSGALFESKKGAIFFENRRQKLRRRIGGFKESPVRRPFSFQQGNSQSRSVKETWLQETPRHGNNSIIQRKRRKGHLNKRNSHNRKHTSMFISDKTKAKNWFLRYYFTFIPKRQISREVKPACRRLPQCKGCPYPDLGFLCWGEDDHCLRNMVKRFYEIRPP